MKVVFKITDNNKSLMRNLHKLKNIDPNNPFSGISVANDMTKTERENNKEMVEKAKEKTDRDPLGKRYFLVRGPPWARKIVKIPKKD